MTICEIPEGVSRWWFGDIFDFSFKWFAPCLAVPYFFSYGPRNTKWHIRHIIMISYIKFAHNIYIEVSLWPVKPFTDLSWWLHQMETFPALLALCAGNSPVIGELPTQRPVTRSFDVFFDLRLDKRLSGDLRLVIWDAVAFIMTSLYCEVKNGSWQPSSKNPIHPWISEIREWSENLSSTTEYESV